MSFTEYQYVGTTTRTITSPIVAYEEVERITLAFTASVSTTVSYAPEPRHVWYSFVDVYTTHTPGVTYYTSSGTVTPSDTSSLVGISVSNVDSVDISNLGTYVAGNVYWHGSSCFYESAQGAGDYTPVLDGYIFTPSTETATGSLGRMGFSAAEGEPDPDPPDKATNPSPTNSSTTVTLDQATLTWTQGVGADTEEVFFGPSGSMVSVQDGSGTTFDLSSYLPFPYGTTYQWRIDSTNDDGTTTGDTWSFTTITFSPPVITEGSYQVIKRLCACAENRFWYEDI